MTAPRPRGRPRSPQTDRIWIRLTPEERQLLEERAARMGLSLSAYVRMRALEG